MAQDKMNIQYRIKAVDNFSKTMKKLDRQLDKLERKAKSLDTVENIKINVTGDKLAERKIEKVEDKLDELERKNIIIRIGTDIKDTFKDARRQIAKMAAMARDVGEVLQHQLFSWVATLAPSAVAGIASIGGALGGLLPILGTVGGGVMGLASAFSSAGAGAVAFGALAVSTLGDVFKANQEIRDLRKELANTDDLEKRAELTEEIAQAYEALSKEQRTAVKSLEDFQGTWSKLSSSLQPQVVTAFSNSLEAADSVLQRLTPMFESVADSAVKLSESLKLNVETDDFNSFIDYLNTNAAPMMETMTRAVGNFGMGFANMMVAFNPLAEDMASGLENMSKKFRDWTAGLAESEKFNAFIDYVRENGPKILEIIGGIVQGLTDMGIAFAPLGEDMLDGLVEMVDTFKEWADNLSENPAFQEFLDYVKTNGPQVLELLGQLSELLINIGKGFADVSEWLTPLVTNFLEWTNSLMENHPILAQILAVLTSLAGIFGILAIPVRLVIGLLKLLGIDVTKVSGIFTKFKEPLKKVWSWLSTKLLPIVMKFLPWIARLGSKFLWLGGPIGFIIGLVIEIALAIAANWDKIWAKTKEIFGKVRSWIKEKWDQIKNTFEVVKAIAKTVWNKFTDIYNAVKEKLGDVWDKVKDIWGKVEDFLQGIDLFEMGKNIIDGLIKGIGHMAGALVDKAKGVVNGAIEGAKNLLKINSPSKVFYQFGEWTGQGFVNGLDKMSKAVKNTSEHVFGGAIPDRMSDTTSFRSYSGYATRDSRYKRDYGRSENQSGGSSEVVNVEVPLYINGRQFAKANVKDITKQQERKERLNKIFEEDA